MASTWRLWVVDSGFPAVPLFEFARTAPLWFDRLLHLVIIIGLAGLLVLRGRSRWECAGAVAVSSSLAASFVLNQHRIQPWAYLAAIGCLAFTCGDPGRTLSLWRILSVSVYIFSAMSKIDYAFLDGMGLRFLTIGLSFFRSEPSDLPRVVQNVAIFAMPAGELAIGCGLLWERTRLFALALCVLLHGTLILILGPAGLHHQPAVLIWNAEFMLQVLILFTSHGRCPTLAAHGNARTFSGRLAEWVTVVAMVCPLWEPVGIADHWPSWSLYSEQVDKVEVYVRTDAVSRVPWELRQWARTDPVNREWTKVYIEQWSLNRLRAPVYPEDRFQLGIAIALAERCRLDRSVLVRIHSPPHRRRGDRTREDLVGMHALREKANSFWLNARPREE
jgi:hypothetical protein